jgi:hypothetical protein
MIKEKRRLVSLNVRTIVCFVGGEEVPGYLRFRRRGGKVVVVWQEN